MANTSNNTPATERGFFRGRLFRSGWRIARWRSETTNDNR